MTRSRIPEAEDSHHEERGNLRTQRNRTTKVVPGSGQVRDEFPNRRFNSAVGAANRNSVRSRKGFTDG